MAIVLIWRLKMKKQKIKNCPAYNKTEGLGIGICLDKFKLKCESVPDCLLKRIYKEFKNCNCELINLLEIEEAE